MSTALDGIRVIDLTRAMAGPFCCMLLGDMGADVIKVEPPGGDSTRICRPHARGRHVRGLPGREPEQAGHHARPQAARKAVAVLERLVGDGRCARGELPPGRDAAAPDRPREARLRSIRAWSTAPSRGSARRARMRRRGGYDLIAQGMSGIMSATGSPTGRPSRWACRSPDLGAGLFAVVGILCALRARRRDGAGPARRHLAIRGGARALGVGGDGVLVHGADPAPARHRPSPERAVSGVPRERRPLHRGRRQ